MKLKVFRGNLDGVHEVMIASTSQKDAANKLGVSLNYFRQYCSETSNEDDIKLAIGNPGAVFKRRYSAVQKSLNWRV